MPKLYFPVMTSTMRSIAAELHDTADFLDGRDGEALRASARDYERRALDLAASLPWIMEP